ncbi:MAG: tetratricopeptide repeat protein [Deltaproteobacteria bacterium]|nr:tetratricopeptide repeat protein [Deltaproteobacteria bacterium]
MKKEGRPAAVVNIKDYMPKRDDSNLWTHLFVLLVILVAVYYNSLGNGFVADDNGFVKDNTSIRSLTNIPDFFFSPKSMAAADAEWGTIIYRPLRTASYAIDYAIFGLKPYGYHLVNLLLHMGASVSLYFVVLSLFNIPGAAFLSSLLFALHPVHIEAVSWIASRADLIGMILFNLTLLSYFRYKEYRSKGYLVISLVLSFLAYIGKETMVSLPALIITYDYVTRNRRPVLDTIKANFVNWLLFSAVCLAYMVIRFNITGRMSTNQGWWGGTAYSNFLMMAEATAIYLRLMVIPYGFTFHYIIDPVYSLFDPGVMVSVFAILLSIAAIIYFHFKQRMVFFSLLWFYIALVPIANIVPISFSMMAERYIYMPSAGPIIAAGYGLYYAYKKLSEKSAFARRAAVAVIVLIFFIYSVEIIMRNEDYKDEFAFYASAVRVSPASPPSNKGLADQYFNRKEYGKAVFYYEKAIEADPGYVEALLGEALTYRESGELEKALAAAKKAAFVEEKVAALKPKNALIRFNLGNIYKEMGDLESARAEWEKAVELNPEYSEAYNHLGIYYQLKNDYKNSILMYENSIRANPFNAETHYNVAMLYDAEGASEKARAHYKSFIELAGPEYGDVVEGLKGRNF